MRIVISLTFLCSFCIFASIGHASSDTIAPEKSTLYLHKDLVSSKRAMVVTAHPLATDAGLAMLRAGGKAIDAAIAAQLVLNVVEPQSSGIGGGGFLLYYHAHTKQLTSYDGRETAPSNVTSNVFLDIHGKPLPFFEAVRSGKSVGTPGLVDMLKRAHNAHGKLPWKQLFTPAITIAENGFPLTARLHQQLSLLDLDTVDDGIAKIYFKNSQELKPANSLITNPSLANSLRLIADKGTIPFYHGQIAQDIIGAVQSHPSHPGTLTLEDLASYQSKLRPAVCGNFLQYKICSMGPPSSGGITLLQILGIIQHFNLSTFTADSKEFIHLFSEITRLAFADRNHYIADSDFVNVPTESLLDPDYLLSRARIVSRDKVMEHVPIGYSSYEPPSTTHMSIVDAYGNSVSMTTSIEHAFGSGLMTGGFLLNNQLTDFSFKPEHNGRSIANRVAPGKRPRSSMTPTIVFDEHNNPLMVIGSPGGAYIISYVAQTILAVLAFDMDIQSAINLPRHSKINDTMVLEKHSKLESFIPYFEKLGHKTQLKQHVSGLHAIVMKDGMLQGGADPRREGIAKGF